MMDIDDILRQVDPSSHGVPSEARDLQALTRLWVAERSAPELLEWPTDGLFERVNARIKTQIEKVEDMTGDMDPKTNFALIVIQTELERYKFLMRSFLRARLAKIDKHTLHYLSSQELRDRLSPTELSYATKHQALLHNHYLSSFLASFPQQLQNLNDTAGNISMIDSPDLDTAVFIRMLRDKDVYGKGTDADITLPATNGDHLPNHCVFHIASGTTVVLFTITNKGISLKIAKKLAAENPDCCVIASCRRPNVVKEAISSLRAQGLGSFSLIIDITSDGSIATTAETGRN
ncbi:hypothetical protein FGRA07_06996 [Fusarium graminearum]|nr:hypothetical protein HG531_002328 [Fusarium graminearum]PCD18359.1 hypothetical protein FGRA07_06996 [Fusarium graminearum]